MNTKRDPNKPGEHPWPPARGLARLDLCEQHMKIISYELNPERRGFYELCWELGGS
jgi:hypothetical protein